ncbi:hypothetical protein LOK49_LG04G02695 [Camellia lanceoleosa]|uniref:Uncharacterized protein n=1 Tax=Camellia lanceoleosa TaxID=1840588 RepID=A0ACC0I0I8_9ERIC|nr:hypothetical protein LOK49_LG04G02695 [Camellia lanceoleosa]
MVVVVRLHYHHGHIVGIPDLLKAGGFTLSKLRASRIAERLKPDDDGGKKDGEASSGSDGEDDDPLLIDEEQRQEWSRKIREVIYMNPDVEEEVDPVKRRKKMQKLLADYPHVVEEDDPDWPEDSDGPLENERMRDELEKVRISYGTCLPSPRCPSSQSLSSLKLERSYTVRKRFKQQMSCQK